MFTVYHSNQLDLLKTLTSALIARDPLTDPFQQEVVLVQSPGMAQWLQMQLAEQFGIAANVAFPLPATFIGTCSPGCCRIFRKRAPSARMP